MSEAFKEFGGKLDNKMKNLEERVDKKVSDLASDVKVLDKNLNNLTNDVKILDSHVKHLDKKVNDLTSDVKILDSNVKNLDRKVEDLTSDVKDLSKTVGDLATNVNGLDIRVGNLEDSIASLKSDFSSQLATLFQSLVDKIDASSSKAVSSSWRISITVGAFVVALLGLSFYGSVKSHENDFSRQQVVQRPLENSLTEARLIEIIRAEI